MGNTRQRKRWEKTHCQQPDRDSLNGKMRCGYPLPCPFHTVTLDLTTRPPTLVQPLTMPLAKKQRDRLTMIAVRLAKP